MTLLTLVLCLLAGALGIALGAVIALMGFGPAAVVLRGEPLNVHMVTEVWAKRVFPRVLIAMAILVLPASALIIMSHR